MIKELLKHLHGCKFYAAHERGNESYKHGTYQKIWTDIDLSDGNGVNIKGRYWRFETDEEYSVRCAQETSAGKSKSFMDTAYYYAKKIMNFFK